MCGTCAFKVDIKNGRYFFLGSPELSKDITNEKSKYDRDKWTIWRKYNFSFFEKHLNQRNEKNLLLDIGAGPVHFRDIFFRFERYVGMDFYPFEYVTLVADITKRLPIKSGSVDIVALSNVLEHTPEPELLINESLRTLNRGGIIVGTVPFSIGVHQEPYDYYRYTPFMLERLLKNAGATSIKVEPLGTPYDVLKYHSDLVAGKMIEKSIEGKLSARLPRKALNFYFALFGSKLKTLPADPHYALGYGFVAKK